MDKEYMKSFIKNLTHEQKTLILNEIVDNDTSLNGAISYVLYENYNSFD